MKSPVGLGPSALLVAGASVSRTSLMVRSPFPELQSAASGCDGRTRLRDGLLGGGIEDLFEAAPEHALAIERHLALGPQAFVGHDLAPRLVAGLLVGPFNEAEDDRLAVLGFHRAIEVGDLTVIDTVGDRFAYSGCAMLPEHLGHLGCELAISLAVCLRHRNDEAVGVRAAGRTFLDDRIEPAHDHALAVEGHVRAHFLHA